MILESNWVTRLRHVSQGNDNGTHGDWDLQHRTPWMRNWLCVPRYNTKILDEGDVVNAIELGLADIYQANYWPMRFRPGL